MLPMKQLLTLLSFLFLLFLGHAQTDTLDLDLDKAALDMKKCRKYLWLDRWRKLSSPPLDSWTKADSIFLQQDDTLYLRIHEKGQLRLEGLRRYDQLIGDVFFYDEEGQLVRREFRVEGLQSGEAHDNEYVGTEIGTWVRATDYENGSVLREIERSIGWDEKKKWLLVTVTRNYRNGQLVKTRERRQAFLRLKDPL
jgi:hypothetical protein